MCFLVNPDFLIVEDGGSYRGYDCIQTMCIGSYQTELLDDPHTTVCNSNQPFFYSEWRESEWTSFYVYKDKVNSICGFGKETPDARS